MTVKESYDTLLAAFPYLDFRVEEYVNSQIHFISIYATYAYNDLTDNIIHVYAYDGNLYNATAEAHNKLRGMQTEILAEACRRQPEIGHGSLNV